MEKIRYETDPFNRLIISEKNTGLSRHRRVADGLFMIDKDSNLIYQAKSPIEDGAASPYLVKFSGTWSLTKNHDIKLTVSAENARPARGELTLRGEMLGAKGDSLLFAVTTKTREGARKTYVLELSGTWHVGGDNRLAFSVQREKGASEVLIFTAGWRIDKNNELIYEYERSRGVRKARKSHRITFKGYWTLTRATFLSYSIYGASNSSFDFRIALGICGPHSMKFELGAGLSRHLRPMAKTVILYGSWKLSKSAGLNFETQYAGGRIYSMSFGAQATLTGGDRVTFRLKDPAGKKDLGLEVALSHDILGSDGSAFIKLLKSSEESSVLIGAAGRW